MANMLGVFNRGDSGRIGGRGLQGGLGGGGYSVLINLSTDTTASYRLS